MEEYGIEYDGDICAEAWELSCHPDGPSVIENGPYKGRTLAEYIDTEGAQVLGSNCRRFREFPILAKFIDARENLSVQVHPGNGFALQNEGQYGKTEMWYVLDAEEGAFLYYGFKREISRKEFEKRIAENTLTEVLNAVPVKKGDALFIESGTLHAIGKGILIAEIQQNSNVTYRVYDYGRVGKDGKKRDLHIEKALAVTNRVPIVKSGAGYPHIADCDYFTVDKLNLDGRLTCTLEGNVSDKSFMSVLILDGEGTISSQGEEVPYRRGDSFFLSAGSGKWQIEGRCDALLTTIREKASPVRAGVVIGSSKVQIGLVNDQQHLIASESYPTRPGRPSEEIIREAADSTMKLLRDNNVSPDQCIGVGVGVPGTIDRKSGTVIYSNNLRWEQVLLASDLEKIIPCPVRIANDADCAALGEALAGAGKAYSDVVMFTLGNGVGGGIILNGNVFEGGMIGGSEVGHQVIQASGRQCTCGRKGCLEAYVSVPALLKSACGKLGKEVSLEDVFGAWSRGEEEISGIMEQYCQMLGQGIVNIVNMFRPQLILLGGQISRYSHLLIPELRSIMEKNAFGGVHGNIPEIAVAQLGETAGIIGAANL